MTSLAPLPTTPCAPCYPSRMPPGSDPIPPARVRFTYESRAYEAPTADVLRADGLVWLSTGAVVRVALSADYRVESVDPVPAAVAVPV